MMKLIKVIIVYFLVKAIAFYQELQGLIPRLFGKEVIRVYKEVNSSRLCIYASFQKKMTTPLSMQLQDLKKRGFDIVFVSNLPIDREFEDYLKNNVKVLIQRPNFGRDFGAYKSGFDFSLSNDFYGAEELLFTNDTILFPICNSDKFWGSLQGLDAQIVGPFLSFTPLKHIQSFFILCKKNSFKTEKFKEYWNQYPNSNARQSVIFHGELGFSKWLSKNSISFDAIIAPTSVLKKEKMPGLLPVRYCSEEQLTNQKLLNLYSEGFELHNPSHIFSLYAVISENIPMLKKDLLSRGTLMMHEIISVLEGQGHNLNDIEIFLSELMAKPLPSQKNMITKFLESIGAK